MEAERKILEDKVDYENKTMTGRMEEIDSRNEVQTKVFKNLQEHTDEVMKELSDLKGLNSLNVLTPDAELDFVPTNI